MKLIVINKIVGLVVACVYSFYTIIMAYIHPLGHTKSANGWLGSRLNLIISMSKFYSKIKIQLCLHKIGDCYFLSVATPLNF